MNKKILKIVFASAFALVASYSVYTSQQKVELSDLAIVNVEAMASSENGCISKNDKNNGDCTNGGTTYFCENSTMFHDCVKGEYPR